ncbi:MAG: hypothetical protein H0X37_17750 [Herpetosiphonaceae bacterium]|nr:hypothetical protein [Herpetosiphonaceae bacterium]
MSKLPWNGPLFAVTGQLATRYAQALHSACDLNCPLTEFSIDRMGWSPQLAALHGPNYLGADALRYGIILSPDQAEAPLIRRRFSYESPLIEQVYLQAKESLLHLIDAEAVVVELDSGLAFCRSAVDVLAIKQVEARLTTPRDTIGKTRLLLERAAGFHEQSRILDDQYIDEMLALVKEVGDPRRQPLPPELILQIGSVWADVAGDVYVLRLPSSRKTDALVITASADDGLKQLPVTPLQLDNPALVDVLHATGLLHYVREEALLQKRLVDLEREALLVAGEAKHAPNDAERRRQIARNATAQAALPQLYWELDGEVKRLHAGATFDVQRLSVAARWALSAPTRDADVMVHLLTRFVPYDYALLIHHHPGIVQMEWPSYSEAKRRYLEANFPYLVQSFVETAAAPVTAEPQQDVGARAPT